MNSKEPVGQVVAIRGNIIYTPTQEAFFTLRDGYLVMRDGHVQAVVQNEEALPADCSIIDRSGSLIMPGFVDLHVHAPQFNMIGMGMDLPLLGWLNSYTFVEEPKFRDLDYAESVYRSFVDELASSGTTRSSVFGTIHLNATQLLCRLFEEKGLGVYVGKVNMDTGAVEALTEDTAASLRETEEFLQAWKDNERVKPIVTPRFALSTTREMLEGLKALSEKYQAPVQSHLSENKDEIRIVGELFPERSSYMNVYEYYGMYGQTPTLMAHCVHLTEDEIRHTAQRNVWAVHCPDSNLNLTSGLMPARKMLNAGVKIGLGSDVGAGHTLFMPHAVVRAIEVSKARCMQNPEETALKLSEAFYMATKGGGAFFGKVGSFEKDYAADILVVDSPKRQQSRTVEEQLAYFIYHGSAQDIQEVYVNGRNVK